MTPQETSRELRFVQRKHEDDFTPTFSINISDMARDAANAIDELLAQANCCFWIPVTERLPSERDYDWVLVRTRTLDNRGYGLPHIAELRKGVWYSQDCDLGPMEEILDIKVTDWFPMELIANKLREDQAWIKANPNLLRNPAHRSVERWDDRTEALRLKDQGWSIAEIAFRMGKTEPSIRYLLSDLVPEFMVKSFQVTGEENVPEPDMGEPNG